MQPICIHDPSLRDGSHAVNHQLSLEQIQRYTRAMDSTGVDVIEVGHGLGLGASSAQLGFSKHSDEEMLDTARAEIKNAKLGAHITPGYGKKSDLLNAIKYKIDVLRVAAHCTEANMTEAFIQLARENSLEVYAALTMSHMLSDIELVEQAKLIQGYGATGLILMDSAGCLVPREVRSKISLLSSELHIKLGFHAHNNLGLAVANSVEAALAGAEILDGTAKGFGAGAGNTPIELLVAVLQKHKYCAHINFSQLLKVTDESLEYLVLSTPKIKNTNIMSGIHGVFCGFDLKVISISEKLGINPLHLYEKLGQQKILAGQEDKIIQLAYEIKQEVLV